jgi:biotin synthase
MASAITPDNVGDVRHNYSNEEIEALYALPFPRLIHLAQSTHKKYFSDDEVQLATLVSVKTGGCKEDCGYCSQSAHNDAETEVHGLMDKKDIMDAAMIAKENGSTRLCMGAAWRSPPKKGKQFDQLLDTIKAVHNEGLEVCVTLGMLDEEQAMQLAEAGVHSYNHNLDTSPEYYKKVITTRTYEDRLETLKNVRKAGMNVCCGGIVGMGEGRHDRVELLRQLNILDPHPESVPVNLLIKVPGTPMEAVGGIDSFELIRTVAVARIMMPKSRVRLSAGRSEMNEETQALCFVAGANSIFTGDKLLTADNPDLFKDEALLFKLNMKPLAAEVTPRTSCGPKKSADPVQTGENTL